MVVNQLKVHPCQSYGFRWVNLQPYRAVTGAVDDEGDATYVVFVGGGAALSFEATMEDTLDGYTYSWDMEAEGGVGSAWDVELAIVGRGVGYGRHDGVGISAALTHVNDWVRKGSLTTEYHLGDPDQFDKFAVRVLFDR